MGECPFQAKTTKTLVKHQREAHGIDVKQEDTFDSSVNISALNWKNRSSGEEDDKRFKLSVAAVSEQSQGEIERKAVRARALAIAGNDQREALNTSKILLESRGQVETSDLFADSDSMLIIIIIIMEVMQIYTVHWIKRNL